MLHRSSLSLPVHVTPASGCRPPTRACSWVIGPIGRKLCASSMLQWTGMTDWRLARSLPCPSAALARSDSALFRHPGELDLNLQEYMVVLEKPVGLTLAPDPMTGQVVVQDIRPNSPAHKCGLIQVGDVVKSCSAVFGDEMWTAVDIRRVRWAINSRMGDVKLLLERAKRRRGGVTAWYCGGKPGVVTRERDGMQLPYTFNGTGTAPEEAGTFMEPPGGGRSIQMAFHRNTVTQPPPNRRAAAAAAVRTAALQRLRRELNDARNMPRVDLSSGLHQRPGGPDVFATPPQAPGPGLGGPPRISGGGGDGGGVLAAAAASSGRAPANGSGGSSGSGGGPPATPLPLQSSAAAAVGIGNGNNGNGAGDSGSGGGGNGGGGLLAGLKLGSGSTGDGGTAAATATATAAAAAAAAATGPGNGSDKVAAAKEKKVVMFLPWLLVSSGRLEHRDMATIASNRSLGAILELSLTRAQQQPPQQQQLPQGGSGGGGASSGSAAGSSNSKGGSSVSGGNSSSSSSNCSSSSSKNGGYLVVRGTDLAPLASDLGRVSYQTLLAAARAAANPGGSTGGPPPPPPMPRGEDPPPPPPGSAAATAAMIDGTDPIAAGGNNLVTAALTDAAISSGASGGGSAINGNVAGSSSSGSSKGGSGGGLGSSTMAFLNRSIFLNLRPSMPFTSPSSPKAMNPLAAATATATSSPSPSTSAANGSSTISPATTPRPLIFSPLPTSRYDHLRVRHLLNAAASLQRLAFRRGGRLHRARRDACAVLLHCDEDMEADVAVLLAGWLHWYRRLPLQEAILAAETAMGTAVDQALLEAGTSALLQGARERCSRVVLTWKYGGLSAYVAGDVVASWSARVPMVRCRSPMGCKGDTHPGHFFLEVQGLRPGVYYYKYIVDGTWAVDSYSSKVLDVAGNWNNVLVVPEPPVVLTSREGLALARWQAARLALESKMGLMGPGAVQRPT